MAIMYPEKYTGNDLGERNEGEEKFYDLCKKYLSDDYYVIHNLIYDDPPNINENISKGEVDFLIGNGHYDGFIVIEVKGGKCSFDNGSWLQKNRKTGEVNKVRPFDQATRYARHVKKLIKEKYNYDYRDMAEHAVYFIDSKIEKKNIGSITPKWRILDSTNDSSFQESIESVFDKGGYDEPSIRNINLVSANVRGLQIFKYFKQLKAVGVKMRGEDAIGGRISYTQKRIVELTENQLDCLDSMRDYNRVYVKGCAGSGKTILALEKSMMLAQDRKSVLLVCFNRELSLYLMERCEQEDCIKVGPYQDLFEDFLNEIGVPLKHHYVHDFHGIQGIADGTQGIAEWYDIELPQLVSDNIARIQRRYDVIIVDEAQDCPDNYMTLLKALLKNEDEGDLYLFADNKQDILTRGATPPDLNEMQHYNLTRNLRNSIQIFDGIKDSCSLPDNIKASGVNGTNIEYHTYLDVEEEKKILDQIIRKLRNESNLEMSDVVILGTKSTSRGEVLDLPYGSTIGGLTIVKENPKIGQIRRMSIKTFKGLEAIVIILIELNEELEKELDEFKMKDLLYVGMSRATSHLIILAEESICNKYFNR